MAPPDAAAGRRRLAQAGTGGDQVATSAPSPLQSSYLDMYNTRTEGVSGHHNA